MEKVNSVSNIHFGAIKASREGLVKLAGSFGEENKNFLKDLIAAANDNISADIFVKETEILVKPHPVTDLAGMRVRMPAKDYVYGRPASYNVDYFAHDVYPERENLYYTTNRIFYPKLPDIEKLKPAGRFAKLFDAACHIAEDINVRFSSKVSKYFEECNNASKMAQELNVDII